MNCKNGFQACIVILVLCCLTACVDAENTDSKDDLVCVSVDEADADIPECAAVEFCHSPTFDVKKDDSASFTCFDQGGTDNCRNDEKWYMAFRYDDDQTQLTLFFDATLADDISTASLKEKFDHYVLYIEVPPEGAEIDGFYYDSFSRDDISDFEILEWVNGRLHVKMQHNADGFYSWFESQSENCVNGDILGQCICSYSELPVDVSLDLFLPVTGL